MVIVEYLDGSEATHAATVLRAFGLAAVVEGREVESGSPEEPPLMVWTVATPDLRTIEAPYPERDEATDYIDTRWDREAEDREYWHSGRRYRGGDIE